MVATAPWARVTTTSTAKSNVRYYIHPPLLGVHVLARTALVSARHGLTPKSIIAYMSLPGRVAGFASREHGFYEGAVLQRLGFHQLQYQILGCAYVRL